jgi:hypothetical protein
MSREPYLETRCSRSCFALLRLGLVTIASVLTRSIM